MPRYTRKYTFSKFWETGIYDSSMTQILRKICKKLVFEQKVLFFMLIDDFVLLQGVLIFEKYMEFQKNHT